MRWRWRNKGNKVFQKCLDFNHFNWKRSRRAQNPPRHDASLAMHISASRSFCVYPTTCPVRFSCLKMRLVKRKPDGDLVFRAFTDKDVPAYAILSHTWLANNNEEVSFQDVEAGANKGKTKAGWEKIQFCAEKAAADSLGYFWIDTCCNRESGDSELSESLNSMFRWYQRAAKCYVYLSDVSIRERGRKGKTIETAWEQAFWQSRWFTRGWTLQGFLLRVRSSSSPEKVIDSVIRDL